MGASAKSLSYMKIAYQMFRVRRETYRLGKLIWWNLETWHWHPLPVPSLEGWLCAATLGTSTWDHYASTGLRLKSLLLLGFFTWFLTMAASRQPPDVKQVCDRIMQWAIDKFSGSGNPEVDDAVDCCLMLRSWSCLWQHVHQAQGMISKKCYIVDSRFIVN